MFCSWRGIRALWPRLERELAPTAEVHDRFGQQKVRIYPISHVIQQSSQECSLNLYGIPTHPILAFSGHSLGRSLQVSTSNIKKLETSLLENLLMWTGPDISEEDQAGARFPKMIPCSNWELSRCRSVHPCDLAPAKELGVDAPVVHRPCSFQWGLMCWVAEGLSLSHLWLKLPKRSGGGLGLIFNVEMDWDLLLAENAERLILYLWYLMYML